MGVRVPLPQLRTNGHAAALGRVFVITGLSQQPRFRLPLGNVESGDFCLIFMGTPGGAASSEAGEADPYFVLRRASESGAAVAVVRVEWEGIFALLSNDDEAAETLYAELIASTVPEDVNREWSVDPSTLAMFAELVHLA